MANPKPKNCTCKRSSNLELNSPKGGGIAYRFATKPKTKQLNHKRTEENQTFTLNFEL